MNAALALIRAAHFASAMLVFGVSAYRYTQPRAGIVPGSDSKLQPFVVAAMLVALVTQALWFGFVAAAMAGRSAAVLNPAVLHLVLFFTDFGVLWIWRFAFAVLLGAAVFFARPGNPAALLLSAVFLASLSLTGHAAAGSGAVGALRGIADATHLLGGGIWLGGLIALSFDLKFGARDATMQTLRRFSAIAVPAVALVFVTGALNAFFTVPDWAALPGSRYGALLFAKLGFAAVMLVLALFNRLVLMPRLGAGDVRSARRIQISVAGELASAAAVLLIVGVLGISPP